MKNKFKILMSTIICVLFYTTGYAQGKPISGVITDASKLPIPGVNVLIKGTQKGVSTDLDGKFVISAPDGATLVISYLGFTTKEVKVGGASTYNITLESENAALQEVVVVGYGTKKKKDLTGSIVSINAEDITSRPVQNAMQAMQEKRLGLILLLMNAREL